MVRGRAGASANRQNSIDVCHNAISTLNRLRSNRVANLLSGFPSIHYAILVVLGLAICAVYLFEANVRTGLFLNLFQIRSMFATIVAVLSATAALCLDLADPFRGSFAVTNTANQLTSLEKALKADLRDQSANALTSTVGIDETRPVRRSTSTRETLLFHLFTSKFADTARFYCDVFAIVKHFVVKGLRFTTSVLPPSIRRRFDRFDKRRIAKAR